MPPRTRLIIGVDYGTTYSGISFATSTVTDPKDITDWKRYPGASRHQAEYFCKAPSWVALPEENSDEGRFLWGYEVEPHMTTRQWVKLRLDSKTNVSKYDDPRIVNGQGGGASKLPPGWRPARVVTEYLRGMRKMLWDGLIESLGEAQLRVMPIDVWVTVPAVWSDHAKLLTKTAAIKAGFASRPGDTIQLIAEPEAAAHISIRLKLGESEELVEAGTGLLVCDAGGGTVDITTYMVASTKPKLILDELCPGAGGKCGGSFVDRNFHHLLVSRFGDAYLSIDEAERGPGSDFLNSFELNKRSFSATGRPDKKTGLQLYMPRVLQDPNFSEKYENHYSLRTKRVLLSHEDWRALFDPVVDQVIKLVLDQVKAASKVHPIQTLILVGGFGSAPYLQERLKGICREKRIRFTTPLSGGWSAVMRGAVLCGLEESAIRERKCRRHYGLVLSYLFDKKRHGHIIRNGQYGKIFINQFLGNLWISHMTSWSFEKGRVITEDTEIDVTFDRHVWASDIKKTGMQSLELIASGEDEAPEVFNDKTVENVGEITYSLKNVKWASQSERTAPNGKKYYALSLVCRLRLADKAGHMTMKIFHGEDEMGEGKLDLS